MTTQPDIFAVIWVDPCLGGIPMSLHEPDAESAIAKA